MNNSSYLQGVMILKARNTYPVASETERFSDSGHPLMPGRSPLQRAVELVSDVAGRYEIAALSSLLATTRAALARRRSRSPYWDVSRLARVAF